MTHTDLSILLALAAAWGLALMAGVALIGSQRVVRRQASRIRRLESELRHQEHLRAPHRHKHSHVKVTEHEHDHSHE